VLSLLVVLVLCLIAPADGRQSATAAAHVAECGGVERAGPQSWHRRYRPPLALGDSTMLLSLPALARDGFSANARGCRQYSEALTFIGGLAHANQLPHLVVIALGANGAITTSEVRETLDLLGPTRVLVLVTQRQSGGDRQVLSTVARKFSAQIKLLDWVAYSSSHPDWFQPDGLHLTFAGAAGFARLLRRAVALAAPYPPTPRAQCHALPPGPPKPLGGVGALAPHGRVRIEQGSARTSVTLVNDNPFPVLGVARLHSAADGTTIASACVSILAASRAGVALPLGRPTLAELQLRGRVRVRLELALEGAEGARATVTRAYSLR
jgi:hypothetical protein